MSDIWVNIRAYEAMLDDLKRHHDGKFVVFHDGKLVDTFDNLDNAAIAALRQFGRNDTYLIRRVGQADEMAMPASVAFRPIDAATD